MPLARVAFLILLFTELSACSPAPPDWTSMTPVVISTKRWRGCLSWDEYQFGTMRLLQRMYVARSDVTRLLKDSHDSPSLYMQSKWISQMRADLDEIERDATTFKSLYPPRGLQEIDTQIKMMAAEYLLYVEAMRKAPPGDTTAYDAAWAHVVAAIPYMKKAQELLESQAGEFSPPPDETCP